MAIMAMIIAILAIIIAIMAIIIAIYYCHLWPISIAISIAIYGH